MILIDGSQGEGGGQILRTSLSLSAVTGTPVRIDHIRARRAKPGLQRQHLMAVQAAARVCNGMVEGAELGSRCVTLTPQAPCAGTYGFDIGSAGSTMLVLQTVLPVLLRAQGPSSLVIRGGTHNSMAPPFEFIRDSLFPVLHGIGIAATIELERHGFHPAGGGEIRVSLQPWEMPVALALVERGKAIERHAEVLIANLPGHVASREAMAIKHGLHWSHAEVDEREVRAAGPGNVVLARLRYAGITTVCTAFGEMRKRAEQVAEEVVHEVDRYLSSTAPVCEHLADQLLLPLAIGVGGSFRTRVITPHTETNAVVIAAFLGPVVSMSEQADGSQLVTVAGAGLTA